MLQLTGQVANVFTQAGGIGKDGAAFDARHKVQLLGEVALPNGDIKYDLMDLTVTDIDEWKQLEKQVVSVDIGAFAPSKGNIIYFVQKGSKPRLND